MTPFHCCLYSRLPRGTTRTPSSAPSPGCPLLTWPGEAPHQRKLLVTRTAGSSWPSLPQWPTELPLLPASSLVTCFLVLAATTLPPGLSSPSLLSILKNATQNSCRKPGVGLVRGHTAPAPPSPQAPDKPKTSWSPGQSSSSPGLSPCLVQAIWVKASHLIFLQCRRKHSIFTTRPSHTLSHTHSQCCHFFKPHRVPFIFTYKIWGEYAEPTYQYPGAWYPLLPLPWLPCLADPRNVHMFILHYKYEGRIKLYLFRFYHLIFEK